MSSSAGVSFSDAGSLAPLFFGGVFQNTRATLPVTGALSARGIDRLPASLGLSTWTSVPMVDGCARRRAASKLPPSRSRRSATTADPKRVVEGKRVYARITLGGRPYNK